MDAEAGPSKPVLHTHDISSLLDLRTEFLHRKKAAVAQNAAASPLVNKSKNNILAVTKQETKAKDEQREARQARIRLNGEQLRKEEAERIRRQKILEEKASIYEKMTTGKSQLVYDDGSTAEFLVNFEQKKREIENRETEKSGSANIRDDERDKSIKEPLQPANPLVVHYDPTEDRGRMFGASHVPLPFMDEEKRQEKIEELKQLTEETNRNRAKRKKAIDEMKVKEREAINRLRFRKGLPPLEFSDEEEDKEENEPSADTVNLDEIPLPVESTLESTEEVPPEKKKKYGVREWDRGKVGYTRWITKQREERDEEFRPPNSYYSNK
ncbi:coiled-coil domain-containing protein [Ditylenchus destructor]|uniref:Coiled-coil domain-containing protein n=1 Tax=Ditylenchus destructor TaxID=166010 RepID=A0AAD4NCL2_9BILA|nr:coiled-coil domain-containing protein [Ditylenchus destructor]